MKVFAFIISILLISFIISEDCDKDNVSGKNDCKSLTAPANEYCCYLNIKYTENGKDEEYKGCGTLTKSEYDNINKYEEDYKKEAEKEGDITNFKVKVDCKSSYLQYYLASLLLLIIL